MRIDVANVSYVSSGYNPPVPNPMDGMGNPLRNVRYSWPVGMNLMVRAKCIASNALLYSWSGNVLLWIKCPSSTTHPISVAPSGTSSPSFSNRFKKCQSPCSMSEGTATSASTKE